MTDKVQLIKQEIERLLKENKHNQHNDSIEKSLDKASKYRLLYELKKFIDSLPEEPKKQPKFKVGDTIKGPCNNIFQVKEVLDKQYLLHSENGDELNSIEIVDKYSCISEEPVSEDLEKEIDRYLDLADLKTKCIGITSAQDYFDDITKTAHHFSEWQRKKDVEEMMKTLVGGEIVKNTHNQLSVKSEPLNDTFGKFGDKVKIIIVKEG